MTEDQVTDGIFLFLRVATPILFVVAAMLFAWGFYENVLR